MYIALIILHVVLCIVLIVTILLQAGKGGGLTEMFGGDTAQSVLGTQAPALLKKITEVSAVGFIVTSLVLGMVTARRGQSLFEGQAMPHFPSETPAALPFTPGEAIPDNEEDVSLPPVEPLDIPGSEVSGTSGSPAEAPLSTDDISGHDAVPGREDSSIPEEQN
ncbi:MAG: preprotein translocase subunit SecG [Candidatus Omnitrophota bacterium]